MCDPTLLITSASTLFSAYAQQQQAEVQIDAAVAERRAYLEQIKEKQRQINQQNTLEQSERNKQGMIERAQIAAIAGESGALGFSADRLIGESFTNESLDIASLETNRSNAIKQTVNETGSSGALYNSRVNIAKSSAPSLLETGLQIGGDVYSAKKQSEVKTERKTGG